MINYRKLKNYIEDNEFHIDIFNNRIHIINYEKILSLEENKIILLLEGSKLYLYGEVFSLNKMLDDELLIDGRVTKMELVNE